MSQSSRHYLVGSVALGLQTNFEPDETDLDIICPDTVEELKEEFKEQVAKVLECKFIDYTWGYTSETDSLAEALLLEEIDYKSLDGYSFNSELVAENEEVENYYEIFKVFKLTKTSYGNPDITIYVKLYGYYRSHEGSYYEGYKFVNPIQKVVDTFE